MDQGIAGWTEGSEIQDSERDDQGCRNVPRLVDPRLLQAVFPHTGERGKSYLDTIQKCSVSCPHSATERQYMASAAASRACPVQPTGM